MKPKRLKRKIRELAGEGDTVSIRVALERLYALFPPRS